MTAILTYRPQYTYKRKLEAVLQEVEKADLHDDPLGHGPHSGMAEPSASDQLRADGKTKGYVPSQPLLEYVDITPTDVLQAYLGAKRGAEALKEKILEDLKGEVTIGPPITEYIEAKTPGEKENLEVVYEFEDLHAGHIEGSTKAETLPVLADILEELQSLEPFLEEHIGPIGSILLGDEWQEDGELVNPVLETEREEEAALIVRWVELDRKGQLDMGWTNERNHLLGFLNNRFLNLGGFVNEVDSLISDTSRSAYGGAAAQIARAVHAQPSLAEQFYRTNQERFDRHSANAVDAHTRMRRLVSNRYKSELLKEVVRQQEAKLACRAYIRQVEGLNPTKDDDPFNLFLLDTLDSITATRHGCDMLVEDLYRISELENIQNFDYVQSLRQKNEARQIYRILTGVLSTDPNEGDVDARIEELLST